MRIAVLGGYGNAGLQIVRLAARHTSYDLVIAGRREAAAEMAAETLSAETGKRIEWAVCDGERDDDLDAITSSSDLLLVASSILHRIDALTEACFRNNCHYYDIGLSTKAKWRTLADLDLDARARKLVLISDGGFHPGLAGVLIGYAAENLPAVSEARVGAAFSMDWSGREFSSSTESEFVEEIVHADLEAWEDRSWVSGYRYARKFDFGSPTGSRTCVPMGMREIRDAVRDHPDLQSVGFFISGFGPVVDYGCMPLAAGLYKLGLPRAASSLMTWGLRTFTPSTERATIQLEASGISGRLLVRVVHSDPYFLTAAPVVSCLQQLDSTGETVGVHTQADVLDPSQTLQDLQDLGVEVTIEKHG